jgi:ATP synthase protein I
MRSATVLDRITAVQHKFDLQVDSPVESSGFAAVGARGGYDLTEEYKSPDRVVATQLLAIVGSQVLVTVVVSLLLYVLYGLLIAASAFAGGAIGFTTSWAYARKMAAPPGSDPGILLRNHMIAEVWKLGLTVVLFAAVVIFFKGVATLPLLLTFIATLAVYWVALLFVF